MVCHLLVRVPAYPGVDLRKLLLDIAILFLPDRVQRISQFPPHSLIPSVVELVIVYSWMLAPAH